MKITVFNGSPRAEKGNTHFMVKAFLEGAEKAGAVTNNVFLSKKKINPCMGCFTCWLKTPGICVFKDDMPALLSEVLTSDIIVFAFPLYVDNVSGQMKIFMDRLMTLADPRITKDENGESRHQKRYDQPSPGVVVISNCGFPEYSHFQVVSLLFKRFARNLHSKVLGEIYRTEGELLCHKRLLLKPVQFSYKKLMNKCGEEIVKNNKLSQKIITALQKQLVPKDFYVKEANKYIQKRINEIQSK
ncbi:MAG TPA: flavodoxin family protein [Spirochaetota bacterium]|jgi:multimeric flavodoxin WrbA|nr:flavodoxin family protein [Spirochaetota bacterium]HQO22712.1 flavodoxin family protein [Spirochaetota bacterium]HQQ23116.1 flavodoxin family protein [Spirochaetota bacterium]